LNLPVLTLTLHNIERKKIKDILFYFFNSSGSRPASSEGEAPAFNSNQTLLLDPLAINMMPPEFEKPVSSKSFHLDPTTRNSILETQKIHNGIRHLQLVEPDMNFNGFTSAMSKNYAPKGSLV
jgi:hypothetical protein